MALITKQVLSRAVCCLFILCGNIITASLAFSLDTKHCKTVAEYYNKHVGSYDTVPVSPIGDAGLGVCAHTLQYTDYKSCCNADMETNFLDTAVTYLQEHVQRNNDKLRERITQTLSLYQEHIDTALTESRTQTSTTLTQLYRIPKRAFGKTLDIFYSQLRALITNGPEDVVQHHPQLGQHQKHRGQKHHQEKHQQQEQLTLNHVVEEFFTHLFPQVFENLLSDPAKFRSLGGGFKTCLMDSYKDVKPFGRVPSTIVKTLHNAFERARLFSDSLQTLLGVVEMSDNLNMDAHCKRAVTKLQFCSMCSGVTEARPCRGLCMNVMRGCLAYVKDLSPAWDDLVDQFRMLQQGMFHRKSAQEVLETLDGNLMAAIWKIMGDASRIHKHVIRKCQHSSNETVEAKQFSTPKGRVSPSVRRTPGHRLHAIKEDIEELVVKLDESKGFLQRIADDLCRVEMLYDPVMDSGSCWNGSAVGRYMHLVPEASTISQTKDNMEVRVDLRGSQEVIERKNTLDILKRRLTSLLDEEAMQQDEAYQDTMRAEHSGSYSSRRVDVTINDDEDYNELSGSGSGGDSDGGDENREGTGDRETPTNGRGRGGGSGGDNTTGCKGNNCGGTGIGNSKSGSRGNNESGGGNAGVRMWASTSSLLALIGTAVFLSRGVLL